jgi:hypothetical protein
MRRRKKRKLFRNMWKDCMNMLTTKREQITKLMMFVKNEEKCKMNYMYIAKIRA